MSSAPTVAVADTVRTPKGEARRELIIEAATGLFYEHGYHATGIDDIGAAAGITGPGIYRYFDSKNAILMAVFDRIWMKLREGIVAAPHLDPHDALALLVDTHVKLVVDNPAAATLLLQEMRSLPAGYQEMAQRNDSTYRDAWANAVVRTNSALSMTEARLMARSCFWLINAFGADSVQESPLGSVRAKQLLSRMALAALSVE